MAELNQNISNELNRDSAIIIPVLNEEKSISLVLENIPKERICEIIVIDNGSTDNTASIAKEFGATVLYENQKGYGSACQKGLKYCENTDYKNIIFLDGDFSDDPKDLNLILEKLDEGYELVIGSRNLGRAQSGSLLLQAKFGNWLATNLTWLFFGGKKFSDLGPFRGIKKSALKQLNMQDENFGWTMEMQIKAIINKIKYTEVSVAYKKRIGESKISGTVLGSIQAGYKILYTILKYKREQL